METAKKSLRQQTQQLLDGPLKHVRGAALAAALLPLASVAAAPASAQTATPCVRGNVRILFNDLNGNAILDAGDTPIQGYLVTACDVVLSLTAPRPPRPKWQFPVLDRFGFALDVHAVHGNPNRHAAFTAGTPTTSATTTALGSASRTSFLARRRTISVSSRRPPRSRARELRVLEEPSRGMASVVDHDRLKHLHQGSGHLEAELNRQGQERHDVPVLRFGVLEHQDWKRRKLR